MIPLLFVAINKYKEHEKIYINPQKDRFVLHDEWKKAFHSDDEMDERLREVFGGKWKKRFVT